MGTNPLDRILFLLFPFGRFLLAHIANESKDFYEMIIARALKIVAISICYTTDHQILSSNNYIQRENYKGIKIVYV